MATRLRPDQASMSWMPTLAFTLIRTFSFALCIAAALDPEKVGYLRAPITALFSAGVWPLMASNMRFMEITQVLEFPNSLWYQSAIVGLKITWLCGFILQIIGNAFRTSDDFILRVTDDGIEIKYGPFVYNLDRSNTVLYFPTRAQSELPRWSFFAATVSIAMVYCGWVVVQLTLSWHGKRLSKLTHQMISPWGRMIFLLSMRMLYLAKSQDPDLPDWDPLTGTWGNFFFLMALPEVLTVMESIRLRRLIDIFVEGEGQQKTVLDAPGEGEKSAQVEEQQA